MEGCKHQAIDDGRGGTSSWSARIEILPSTNASLCHVLSQRRPAIRYSVKIISCTDVQPIFPYMYYQ